MEQEEIKSVVMSAVGAFKDWEKIPKDKRPDAPEFYSGYNESVDLLSQTRPHCEHNVFPDRLFREKAPNELPAEFEYGKRIYRPITMPYWSRALNTLYKIWNPQNWSWDFPALDVPDEEQPAAYYEQDYPVYHSIDAYFRQVVTPMAVKDANAMAVVMPAYVPDSSERVEPIVKIFNCPDVWAYEPDKWVLLLSDEKSRVKFGNSYKNEGLVFWFVDDTSIWKLTQTGSKLDYEFEMELWYVHNLGYLPAARLKGTPVYKQGTSYWMSPFYPAVPMLDQALVNFNTLQKSIFGHAFLQRWEYVSKCDAVHDDVACDGGWIEPRDGSEKYTCPSCKGSGVKQMNSAMSVFQVEIPERGGEKESSFGSMSIPPAGYIDVNHAILDFLDSQVSKNINHAFQVINIDVADEDAKGDETATGRAIDREEQHSFLIEFAANMFGLMEFCINAGGEMRYLDKWQDVKLSVPTTFDLRKPGELTEELEKAPNIAKRMILAELGQKRFGKSLDDLKRYDTLLAADSLAGMPEREILASVTAGLTPRWMYVLHTRGDEVLDAAIAENTAFFEFPMNERRRIMVELSKKFDGESNPPSLTPESLLNGLGA